MSQAIGYTERRTKNIKVPTLLEMVAAYRSLNLDPSHVQDPQGCATPMAAAVLEYFAHRADVLNNYVRLQLMNADQAKAALDETQRTHPSQRALVMNKQRGDKAGPSPLTNMVNLIIEAGIDGRPCDFDPQQLTTVTRDGVPVRTLARRVDGAFPSAVNPVAVWEIKEYYYTTTFGSRVADGVYETLLDGLELEELRAQEAVDVKHYLFVDSHFTWWVRGRSYLCRIIDMLHMGYVDEVLFGREVLDRLPDLVQEWLQARSPGS